MLFTERHHHRDRGRRLNRPWDRQCQRHTHRHTRPCPPLTPPTLHFSFPRPTRARPHFLRHVRLSHRPPYYSYLLLLRPRGSSKTRSPVYHDGRRRKRINSLATVRGSSLVTVGVFFRDRFFAERF